MREQKINMLATKVDENSIKLQIEDEVVNIEMKNISSGNTVYDFGEEE